MHLLATIFTPTSQFMKFSCPWPFDSTRDGFLSIRYGISSSTLAWLHFSSASFCRSRVGFFVVSMHNSLLFMKRNLLKFAHDLICGQFLSTFFLSLHPYAIRDSEKMQVFLSRLCLVSVFFVYAVRVLKNPLFQAKKKNLVADLFWVFCKDFKVVIRIFKVIRNPYIGICASGFALKFVSATASIFQDQCNHFYCLFCLPCFVCLEKRARLRVWPT